MVVDNVASTTDSVGPHEPLDVRFELIRQGGNFNVEFTGRPGIGVITGPSGSGKTTTFQCIAGLISPTAGHIKMGQKVFFDTSQKINLPPQDRKIGYVLQRPTLFPHMSVRQNVRYAMKGMAPDQMDAIINDLTKTFGISEFLDRRPHQISGGQAQRVAIVRAIASRPELFLLDEPFSNLDDQARTAMLTAIKELRRVTGKPILYITHSVNEAVELADYRISGSDGKFRLD